jgi:hypothetical protein
MGSQSVDVVPRRFLLGLLFDASNVGLSFSVHQSVQRYLVRKVFADTWA